MRGRGKSERKSQRLGTAGDTNRHIYRGQPTSSTQASATRTTILIPHRRPVRSTLVRPPCRLRKPPRRRLLDPWVQGFRPHAGAGDLRLRYTGVQGCKHANDIAQKVGKYIFPYKVRLPVCRFAPLSPFFDSAQLTPTAAHQAVLSCLPPRPETTRSRNRRSPGHASAVATAVGRRYPSGVRPLVQGNPLEQC